ncbi:glycoside hydrolase family 32 protein [Lachnospiraceae bacterium OttesenSCG-928-J05]|nr:glycoside hydrolase family 32 protein [Lachnospiraceae bacterium OttesenSCG-928-J05]
MTQKLLQANQYIEKNASSINQEYRNQFHLMAPLGWINDPNGFVFFRGEYHLFYQYNPYDSVWGPMHWGHAKSKDLIHWEHLPVALAPGEDYDKNGCFSGSAIEKDGKLYLLYTGHNVEEESTRQVQCLAVSEDGVNFEKYAGNPVIDERQLSGVATSDDFRDPKVFRREDYYYTVVAAKTADNRGQILLFRSEDLLEWKFYSVLLEGEAHQGIMWECPDLFRLDGEDVLIISPIQMKAEGLSYRNISSAVAFIGKMDWEKGKFHPDNYHEVDGGLDFYAPQTCENDRGERIMVAWMQLWERLMPTNELGHGWAGSMSLPRKLAVVDKHLIQEPVAGLYENVKLEEKLLDKEIENQTFELKNQVCDQQYLSLELDVSEAENIQLEYAKGSNTGMLLSYDVASQMVTVSREKAGHVITGAEEGGLGARSIKVPPQNHKLKLQMVRDTSSLEVFLNGGKTMSFTFFEKEKGKDIALTVTGKVKLSLEGGEVNR